MIQNGTNPAVRDDVLDCSRTRESFFLSGILSLKRERTRGRVFDALSVIRAPVNFANGLRNSRESIQNVEFELSIRTPAEPTG